MEDRLASCLGLLPRKRRATVKGRWRDDERPVTVSDIPCSPHSILVRGRFLEGIPIGNGPIFRPPPPWAPSSNRHTVGHRCIKRRPINAGLPPRHNFLKLHEI